MANTLRTQKLLETSISGSCDFLKEMKKIKKGANRRIDVPDKVGKAQNDKEVSIMFKEVYSSLYINSSTKEEFNSLKRSLSGEIIIISMLSLSSNEVCGEAVKLLLATLNKARGMIVNVSIVTLS